MSLQHCLRAAVEAPLALRVAQQLFAGQTRSFSSEAADFYSTSSANVIRPLTPRELARLQQPQNDKVLHHQYKLLKMHSSESFEEQYKNIFETHVEGNENTSEAAKVPERPRPAFLPQPEIAHLPFMPHNSKEPVVCLDALDEPEVLTPSLMDSLAKSAAAAASAAHEVYSHGASKSSFDYAKPGTCYIPYLQASAKGDSDGEGPRRGMKSGRLDADADWRLSFESDERVNEPLKLIPPEQRRQVPLTGDQIKKLWARAEDLSRLSALPEVIIGKFGLTACIVRSVDDALRGRHLVRVRLGPTSPSTLSPHFIAFALENALDCSIVRVKGGTVTAFR